MANEGLAHCKAKRAVEYNKVSSVTEPAELRLRGLPNATSRADWERLLLVRSVESDVVESKGVSVLRRSDNPARRLAKCQCAKEAAYRSQSRPKLPSAKVQQEKGARTEVLL